VQGDFFHHGGGVHHQVSGALAGGHCVLVIGYSEVEPRWIIKNFRDVTCGIGGFGKVACSDLKFNGQFFPMCGATGIALPASGWQPLGGKLRPEPVVGGNTDGRVEVFCAAPNWACGGAVRPPPAPAGTETPPGGRAHDATGRPHRLPEVLHARH
jgi:hypothetical protein